jgi:hypothetical protein
MLTFSAKVTSIIASGKGEVFLFVHFLNGNGTLYRASTTHFNSFTASNNVTYLADDFIVAIDNPQISTVVDREQYKLTVADYNFFSEAEAKNGMVGMKVEVRLGFIDPDTGQPLTNVADSLVVYKGKIDSVGATINTEERGDSIFVISCASPMLALDMKKPIFLSKDYIRSQNPIDSCCDSIYKGSSGITLKWGKA